MLKLKKSLKLSTKKEAESLYPIKNTGLMSMSTTHEVYNMKRQEGFIAGATSKYVEKQKLEFAIEQLKKASMLITSQHERKANLRVIIELEQKLKEYE